mgnify:CR=1 FL=1
MNNHREKYLRKELGVVGYKDLDIEKLARELTELYEEISDSHIGPLPELKSIYIVGSFVTEDAIKTASDIDIRFVSTEKTTGEKCNELTKYVKNNWRNTVSEHNMYFGYIDARLYHKKPQSDSVKIY